MWLKAPAFSTSPIALMIYSYARQKTRTSAGQCGLESLTMRGSGMQSIAHTLNSIHHLSYVNINKVSFIILNQAARDRDLSRDAPAIGTP
jgi:hypothetical protein